MTPSMDPPLRVLILSHMFPRRDDDWGGVFVLEEVRALRAAGIDARVLVAEPTSDVAWRQPRSIASTLLGLVRQPVPVWRERRGVPFALVPFLPPHPCGWGALASHSYGMSLRRWHRPLLDTFDPQIIHSYTSFLDGHAGALLAGWRGVPFAIREMTGPFTALTRTRRQRAITEAAVNAAAIVLPVSRAMQRAMAATIELASPDRMRVLSNGYDPEIFHPRPRPSAPPTCFLWIGSMLPVKQPLMLVDAFAAAYKIRSDLRLDLMGHGALEYDIRQRIGEYHLEHVVKILPPGNRAAVATELEKHHALVISSETETFGLVAIEALASGRPVLATRCGGPEEIIDAVSGGEHVANTTAGLADGFLRLAATLLDYDPFVVASKALSLYGYPAIAASLGQIYSDLLENG